MVLMDSAADVFYHDVPEPARSRCIAMLGKHPLDANLTPVKHIGYDHVPSTYIMTTLDRAIVHDYQKWAIERLQSRAHERVAAGETVTVPFTGPLGEFSIESGHSPMVAKPEELAGILGRIAEGI